jgi:CRISPR/Cas system-associated exonuclease Cas4 (RecB family)
VPTPPKKQSVVKKITYWSYSRWQEYVTCPFKAYCKMILKLREPSSPALEKGNLSHLYAQTFVGAVVPPLAYQEEPRSESLVKLLNRIAKGFLLPELETFKVEFKALRAGKYKTEQEWIFKRDWSQTVWNDWGNIWLRVKCDAHTVRGTHGIFVDYKTGKKYPEKHDKALDLYALCMFLMYPQLETVEAVLWYLDLGEESDPRIIERSMVPSLKKEWEKDTFKMLNDTRFSPKPSQFACKYCFFSKEKNGPCKVG